MVFSIDVEDWYQGIEIPMDGWHDFEARVPESMGRLLDVLSAHDAKTTCFVLGKVAEDHPRLIRRIHEEGHEIATHGYSHEKVYNLSPDRFRQELRRSIDVLQDLTGEQILGHRAPYFTITTESLWALDTLYEEGIRYDSSIHPVLNDRYGIPDADRQPSVIRTPAGYELLEVPVATAPLPSPLPQLNIPCGGGAYLRIYPYRLQKWLLQYLERRGDHVGVYIHPWEVDPDHPRINLKRRVALTHYWNLSSTYAKVERLLHDFHFEPYRIAFRRQIESLS